MKFMIKTPVLATLMTCSLVAEANLVDRVINRLDANQDGQVSQEEFNMVDRKMILGLDANEDGVVTMEEVQNHDNERKVEMNERLKAKREQAIVRFQTADIDGDGMVTAEEARTARFNFIDENDDGRVAHSAHLHQTFGLGLYTFHTIHDEDDAVHSGQRAVRVFSKILVTGRV